MAEQDAGKTKLKVVIPKWNEEFEVPGFAEAYEAFIGEDPSRKAQPDHVAFAVLVVGGAMALIGSLSLLVSPSSIGSKALSAIGSLIMLAAVALSRSSAGVSPGEYLASEYELFDNEGPLSKGYAPVKYLGEGKFRVKY